MATQTRAPTSDEAASGTLSGSAGTRWALVDDYPDTTGVDIITFGTVTALITFGFSAFTIPAGSTSISVQVQYYDGEAATGANNCGGRVKVGGSYFNAATHNPAGTTYTAREDNWATNPKTAAAWTVDDVNGVGANALQAFGINSTDSNPTFRVSSVRLQVTYTAPSSSGAGATSAAAQESAATGTVQTSGSAASSAAAEAAASIGAVAVDGSVATAATSQVTSATGEVGSSEIAATGATVATAQASSASATVTVAAQGTTTSASQVTASAATLTVAAVGVISAPGQGVSALGASSVDGDGATTAAAQTAAGTGSLDGGDVTGVCETVAPEQVTVASAYVSKPPKEVCGMRDCGWVGRRSY